MDLCWPLLKRNAAQTTWACVVGVFFFFFFPAGAFLFAFSEIANPSDGPDRSPALLVFVLLLLSGPACSRSDLQPVFQSGANVPL